MLVATDVEFGFPGRPRFLGPISLSVGPGECWAIVGPNGAGKSTLLRLLSGLYTPKGGRVALDDRHLCEYSRTERARRIAFLPQGAASDIDLCVRDIVLMGRFPHRSFGLFESAEDERIAEQALKRTATEPFADRPLATLSGGEAQRVHLAAALAQQPGVLLLDEPTASLDLQHERAIFDLLRKQAEEGVGVVVVTHDVNLAADYCSHVMLLCDGKAVAVGGPSEVLRPEVLAPVYGIDLESVAAPGRADRRWLIPAAFTSKQPLP